MVKIADDNQRIFVFGSNLAGRHGAGAAKFAAEKYGFPQMLGVGFANHCYAIPTKDCGIRTMPISVIKGYVDQFMATAELLLHCRVLHPEAGKGFLLVPEFQVTAIGTGHAGYQHKDIAPLFAEAPSNCLFDEVWKPWLPKHARYWGTY